MCLAFERRRDATSDRREPVQHRGRSSFRFAAALHVCSVLGASVLDASMLGGALLWPAPARADDAAMSRFYHEQGTRHYAGGRFDRAVQEFMTAQRLSPNPRTVYNIGICFLRMDRRDDAFFFLDEYLSSPDEAEGAADRRRFAEEALRSLAPRVARVAVLSNPPGATIYVDQREHGSYGVTPRVLALPPGPHRVWVELPGHRPAQADVTATLGAERTLELAPPRIVGTLTVTGPEGSRTRVLDASGILVAEGSLPLEVALPPGRVEVEVTSEAHRPFRDFATVLADEHVELRAQPEPLPQPTGDVTVTANVRDAVVELDGAPVGLAPLVLTDVPVGTQAVRVQAPGHVPWSGRLEIEASTRTWLTVLLEPEPTGRTPWTWVVGGLGLAGLVAGAVLGGLAVEQTDRFRSAWNDVTWGSNVPTGEMVPTPLALRAQALDFATASDVALVAGGTALALGVFLFFETDDSGRAASSATTTRRPR